MKNVNMTVKKNGTKSTLVIEVDLSQEYGLSTSGKSTIVASTEGNISLPHPHDEIKLGVNIYKKA